MANKDIRKFYQLKTFWGAVAFGVILAIESAGIPVDNVVYQLVTIYTGYSISDRFRK